MNQAFGQAPNVTKLYSIRIAAMCHDKWFVDKRFMGDRSHAYQNPPK